MRTFAALTLVGFAALAGACDVTTDIDGGSGGTASASDTGGQTSGSGGRVSAGGAPSAGGSDGFAGAAGAPSCACFSESSITVELPSGPRTYDLLSEHLDGCNPLECQPDGAYASWRGAPPSAYSMRGCRAEGDCVQIRSGFVQIHGTEGQLEILEGSDVIVDEPITITATLEDADRHQVVTFSFVTTSEASLVATGSGSVCWAESNYICLR